MKSHQRNNSEKSMVWNENIKAIVILWDIMKVKESRQEQNCIISYQTEISTILMQQWTTYDLHYFRINTMNMNSVDNGILFVGISKNEIYQSTKKIKNTKYQREHV
jgi:hypothetical protein